MGIALISCDAFFVEGHRHRILPLLRVTGKEFKGVFMLVEEPLVADCVRIVVHIALAGHLVATASHGEQAEGEGDERNGGKELLHYLLLGFGSFFELPGQRTGLHLKPLIICSKTTN